LVRRSFRIVGRSGARRFEQLFALSCKFKQKFAETYANQHKTANSCTFEQIHAKARHFTAFVWFLVQRWSKASFLG